MKAIFISCNQALYDDVLEILDRCGIRGFTSWKMLWAGETIPGNRITEPTLGLR
ncbi:MAG: hypothetical protein LIO79_10230 [Rikenellaceae bacterium]|nr:hypothetical protein [Rikenellaceae bacterium]